MRRDTPAYITPEAVKAMTVEELKKARAGNSRFAANQYGVTLGALGTARGNVLRIGKELKARGLTTTGEEVAKRDMTGIIALTIAPLQEEAMRYAKQESEAYIARVVKEYEGKDLNAVAPRGNSMKDGRDEYRRKNAKRQAITEVLSVKSEGYMPNRPEMLVRDAEREARFIKHEEEQAALGFAAYVSKLEQKVGAGVTAASVEGKYLWQGSFLTVMKGDVKEVWKTKQIVNYSVLGNAYNQWPTTLMKG